MKLPRVTVIFSGKSENDPRIEMLDDVLAAAGPLAMQMCDFIENDCGTKVTERGIGFGEWDIGFIEEGLQAGSEQHDIPMVLSRFRKAWEAGLFRVTRTITPGM